MPAKKAATRKPTARSSAKTPRKKKAAVRTEDSLRLERALLLRVDELRGETISQKNRKELDWLEKTQRQQAVEQWQKAVPKGDYCKLASRQHKLVDDAARLYELPIGTSVINLRDAITALHDLVASNAQSIRGKLDSKQLEELKEEKLRQEIQKLEKENERMLIELQYSRGNAIPRAQVREGLVVITAKLRTLGQTLARLSPDARDALNNALDAIAEEIESGQLSF